MIRRITVLLLPVALLFVFAVHPAAAQTGLFENEQRQIENSIPDSASDGMKEIGIDGIDDITADGIDISALFDYLGKTLVEVSGGPVSALLILLCIIITAAVAEAYTCSLRYTHTKEIMGVAVSLMIASSVIGPIAELASDSAAVISGASSVMLIYLPIMAGILAFSGHVISSAGYYASVITGAGMISALSSSVLMPFLDLFLSMSVCAGIGGKVKINSFLEMFSKCVKWLLTFAVSIFSAAAGLNSALAGAGGELAGRAARLTLTSLIPIIGSSVSEAYRTLTGSLDLLRSGIGVFVIVAVSVAFVPVLIKALVWTLALNVAKLVCDAFGVSSAARILDALISYFSVLRAILFAVPIAFIISSASMMRIGGSV